MSQKDKKENFMKKLLMVLTMTAAVTSFADHSLRDAMNDSKAIETAVEAAIAKRGVVCDLAGSLQMNPTIKEAAWRQVAFCYQTADRMSYTQIALDKGNFGMGIYGLAVDTILDVEYSENLRTNKFNKVISIKIK